MACCARDCPTVIGERRMVLAGMLNGALRRQPPAAASGRAPCSICLAPDAAVQPFIDVRFASPAVAAGSQTWHACPILVGTMSTSVHLLELQGVERRLVVIAAPDVMDAAFAFDQQLINVRGRPSDMASEGREYPSWWPPMRTQPPPRQARSGDRRRAGPYRHRHGRRARPTGAVGRAGGSRAGACRQVRLPNPLRPVTERKAYRCP